MKYNIYDLIKEIKNNDTMEKVSIDAFCDYGETNYLSDIIKQVQQAQFNKNYKEMYNNINDMVKLYIFNLYKENGIEEINDIILSQLEEIADNCVVEDYLPSFKDIKEEIYEY